MISHVGLISEQEQEQEQEQNRRPAAASGVVGNAIANYVDIMTATRKRKSIYLVDAFTLIFQVFYAIRDMTSPKGFPTNALFGFTRDLFYLHEDVKPDYLVCLFDEGEPDFRMEVFPEYKANRSEMPEDLVLQLDPIRNVVAAMNVAAIGKPGYEADDLIATIAAAADKKNMDVYICTTDKDCRQLITDRVRLLNLRKNSLMGRQELADDWGIAPEQVVDLQSLVGDSVDNINGVPGVGVKTAAKLLQEYETIESLLDNIDKVSGKKRRENLASSAELVKRNRQLVRLDSAVPIEMDWDSWRLQPFDGDRLLELFREWGFHRFADQVQAAAGGASPAKAAPGKKKTTTDQGGLFPTDAADSEREDKGDTIVSQDNWQATYHLVETAAEFETVVAELAKSKRFAFDLETTSTDEMQAEIVGWALCCRSGEAWYVPVRGPKDCTVLDGDGVLNQLRPLLEDEKIAKVNQNIKYDAVVLRQHGLLVKGIAGDSMVADYLLYPAERRRTDTELARRHLDHECTPISALIGKKGPKQKRMDEVDTRKVADYAGEDADVAWRLCELLESRLEKENLKRLYDELEIPLIDVLVEMEFNGIGLHVGLLQQQGEQLGAELKKAEREIYDIAGEEFNIASLNQLRRILFEKLKLKPIKKTGITGAPSTDQETLERMAADKVPIAKSLLQHRRISKLKGTYIDALPLAVNPKTGRVHASFQQTVAVTGRLSSSDPNLQNIPIRSDLGGQIRQAFIPVQGWKLISADYSQVELRFLAHFSEDEELQRAFREDRDVHSLVASQIYGVEEPDVSSEMRRMAKTVNFGVIYGMSAFGLARRLEMSDHKEAEAFIDGYFKRYPRVLEYQQNLLKRCRTDGCVSTLLGRRRSFDPGVIRAHSTYRQRNQAEREALNMEIQGSAADLIKVAMLNIHRRLSRENRQTRMLLQIHDELVFESPPDELSSGADMIRAEMTNALADRLEVPLKVDVAVGPNWLDVKDEER